MVRPESSQSSQSGGWGLWGEEGRRGRGEAGMSSYRTTAVVKHPDGSTVVKRSFSTPQAGGGGTITNFYRGAW